MCYPIEAVACLVVDCDSRYPGETTKLYYFYGPSYYDHRIYDYNELDEILEHDNYDDNKTTVLYMHGYLESAESDSVRLIVNAFHARNEHNLIVLDWSDASYGDYFINAVPNAISVTNMQWTTVNSFHSFYVSISAWQHSFFNCVECV